MENFDRITQTPGVMAEKACIRGHRVTVSALVGDLGAGQSVEQVLAAFPYLEREDVLQAIRFAALLAGGADIDLASAS